MSWTMGPSEGVPDPDPAPGPDDRDWVAMSRRVAATAEAKSASRSTVSGRTERISAIALAQRTQLAGDRGAVVDTPTGAADRWCARI